ncbi:Snf7-domain-containing protein [Daldinia caldariorum]|uniref:Snf7-domain-containing protein n=1 Tax=Daldinia caldariorum TaxID=326644 RepID=UPI002008BF6A|nr:Snf7-domain-containing protein [Daldinia caldariorum]KAI1467849.1 Snf7-domain-containing protein [Daldinia caldariorum]
MSGVWAWFGGSAAQKKKDSPKNAILGLRSQLEMLQKREKHLMAQMEEQDAIARKHVNTNKAAAKAALRRKKGHEHSLEQTISQIGTLEQQINAIESANINRETLAAMQRAGEAMRDIHGKLTPEKVDETMYVLGLRTLLLLLPVYNAAYQDKLRDKLREQNALSEEIVAAITSAHIGETVDDTELDEELDALMQEQLDKKMLESGTVPVSDAIHRMPAVGNTEIQTKPQAVAEDDDDEAELRKLQAEMAM